MMIIIMVMKDLNVRSLHLVATLAFLNITCSVSSDFIFFYIFMNIETSDGIDIDIIKLNGGMSEYAFRGENSYLFFFSFSL